MHVCLCVCVRVIMHVCITNGIEYLNQSEMLIHMHFHIIYIKNESLLQDAFPKSL